MKNATVQLYEMTLEDEKFKAYILENWLGLYQFIVDQKTKWNMLDFISANALQEWFEFCEREV